MPFRPDRRGSLPPCMRLNFPAPLCLLICPAPWTLSRSCFGRFDSSRYGCPPARCFDSFLHQYDGRPYCGAPDGSHRPPTEPRRDSPPSLWRVSYAEPGSGVPSDRRRATSCHSDRAHPWEDSSGAGRPERASCSGWQSFPGSLFCALVCPGSSGLRGSCYDACRARVSQPGCPGPPPRGRALRASPSLASSSPGCALHGPRPSQLYFLALCRQLWRRRCPQQRAYLHPVSARSANPPGGSRYFAVLAPLPIALAGGSLAGHTTPGGSIDDRHCPNGAGTQASDADDFAPGVGKQLRDVHPYFPGSQEQELFNTTSHQVGADFNGVIPPSTRAQPSLAQQTAAYRRIPGVLSASLGLSSQAFLEGSNLSLPLEVRAVDASTYAQTAIWTRQDAAQPLGSLMKELAQKSASAPLPIPAIVDALAWNELHLAPGTTFRVALRVNSTPPPLWPSMRCSISLR